MPPLGSDRPERLGLQEGLRVGPFALLLLELHRLVHEDLSVVGQHDAGALEWPRRRPLEVDAALVEPAAVAGALELVLGAEPVGRAAEMGAYRDQGIEALGLAHDPHAESVLEADVHL